MNFKEIEGLLEKYYNGETTLEEENKLKDFFHNQPVPPDLEADAGLFRYLRSEAEHKLNESDFNDKFLKAIDTPVIPMYSSPKTLYLAISIAATILILAGMVFTFRDATDRPYKNTMTDTRLAYSETRKALMLVSVNFNQGFDQVQHLSAFQSGIDEMQKFSTFYKYQPLIINTDDQRH